MNDQTPSPDHETLRRLKAFKHPEPASADTEQLLQTLAMHMPVPDLPLYLTVIYLLQAQFYVVRQEILAATALIMTLGTALSLFMPDPAPPAPGTHVLPGGSFGIALLAPIVSALGVSLLYGAGRSPVIELEDATPVSQRKILFARLTIIFGLNLLLGLAGSLFLFAAGAWGWIPQNNFFEIVQIWLAPMTALSAAAFFLTVVTGDPLAGSAVSLAVWAVQSFRVFGQPDDILLSLPNLFAAESRPWLWAASVCIGLLALWLAGKEDLRFRKLL